MRKLNHIKVTLLKCLLTSLFCIPALLQINAQDSGSENRGIRVSPESNEGIPIRSVIIILHRNEKSLITDSLETEAFYQAFDIRPGSAFKQLVTDMAINTIEKQADIKSADYEVFNSGPGSPVVIVIHVYFLSEGESKKIEAKKGMINTKSIKDFPVISETSYSKLAIVLNGGVGLFNENNGLFAKGPEFTQGNSIADDPAVKGVRFWGESYAELGLAGIWQLGSSNFYAYGSASGLLSARNTSDIYSNGTTIFFDAERMYAGVLGARLGKNKNINIDASFGRQSFQLNDGFLISKFSGSANAGDRGNVYLNSRTAFQKTAILRTQFGSLNIDGFFLEPEELFKDKQTNTNYAGGTLAYNDNKTIDAGISYITVPSGSSMYSTPQGKISKKGMYVINPKLWLEDIGGTGLFLKSEYAYQSNRNANMKSNAYYLGIGLQKSKWFLKPSLYYRYAFMQGDDSTSERYERFDPILTGGLGNWVQGINFRKVTGNGNIISHRVELKGYLSESFEVSLDYFHLSADTYSNLGGLPPITNLKEKDFGYEITFQSRYYINNNFLFLGIISYAKPGNAITKAFDEGVYSWTSYQAALFMFF